MPWHDLSFAYESVLTAAKLQQLQDNFTGWTNTNSAAKLTYSAITSGAIIGEQRSHDFTSNSEVYIAPGTAWNAADGVYMAGLSAWALNGAQLELYISGAWRRDADESWGAYCRAEANYTRFYNNTASNSVWVEPNEIL